MSQKEECEHAPAKVIRPYVLESTGESRDKDEGRAKRFLTDAEGGKVPNGAKPTDVTRETQTVRLHPMAGRPPLSVYAL